LEDDDKSHIPTKKTGEGEEGDVRTSSSVRKIKKMMGSYTGGCGFCGCCCEGEGARERRRRGRRRRRPCTVI